MTHLMYFEYADWDVELTHQVESWKRVYTRPREALMLFQIRTSYLVLRNLRPPRERLASTGDLPLGSSQ